MNRLEALKEFYKCDWLSNEENDKQFNEDLMVLSDKVFITHDSKYEVLTVDEWENKYNVEYEMGIDNDSVYINGYVITEIFN